MKRISLIILSIFLIHTSPVSAGVGDVYYCISKVFIDLKNFKTQQYKNINFTFKRTAEGITFGKGDKFFKGLTLPRKEYDNSYSSKEYDSDLHETFSWGDDNGAVLYYMNGQYNFTQAGFNALIAQQGTCSVF